MYDTRRNFWFVTQPQPKKKKCKEGEKRVRNVNDRPTQAKYFYVSLREKRRRKKELSQAYFGFMFGTEKMMKKKKRNLLHAAERNVLHAPIVWCQQTLKKAFI